MEIAVIGCGIMGSAFACQWAEKGHSIRLYNRSKEKATQLASEIGAIACTHVQEAIQGAALILLAVKPKDLEHLAVHLKELSSKQLIISILSGVTLERLKKEIKKGIVVRTMPNLALTCAKGITAVAEDPDLSRDAKNKVEELLLPLGKVLWVQELDFPAITALAGSGPSFACALIEAFAEAGIEQGLSSQLAFALTLDMIEGAIGLIRAEGVHPAVIRHKICSPGGATIAGHHALEDYRVQAGIMAAIGAASNKARGKS